VKISVRKGDPQFLLEYVRSHKPNHELADLIDEASRKMRRELKPR